MTSACAAEPGCPWDGPSEPVAPTLARYVNADTHAAQALEDLNVWAKQNLPATPQRTVESVDLLRPENVPADIAATLLYQVTDWPYRELYTLADGWSDARRREVLDVALRSRSKHDDLLRAFRGGLYVFDIVTDIGAWRDLHRHRRCHQFRQAYTTALGYETPPAIEGAGLASAYHSAMRSAFETAASLPSPASDYLLPFGARSRFLFKMDFAEAEYISRLRSGVKGHFSYRDIAWQMREKMVALEPELGRLIDATPPWVEDPLRR